MEVREVPAYCYSRLVRDECQLLFAAFAAKLLALYLYGVMLHNIDRRKVKKLYKPYDLDAGGRLFFYNRHLHRAQVLFSLF